MKYLSVIGIGMIMLASAHAAEKMEREVLATQIKVSKDGTGIVKFKECDRCAPVIARITRQTKFIENGKVANAQRFKSAQVRGVISISYSKDGKKIHSVNYMK